jgi:elongation factor 2
MIRDISPKEYKDKWTVNVQKGTVAFGSAFHNWALSIPYMQEKKITFKDVIDAYEAGDEKYKELAKKAPLHEVVLNMVIKHHPNPIDAQEYRIPWLWRGDLESEEGKSLIKCDPNGPLFYCITKIVVDPQAGEISCGRLFSGTMKKGLNVYLNRQKQETRIQQVFIFNGAKRDIVEEIPAGNVLGIAGVKSYPGETITFEQTEPFEQITHIFEPVITKAIEATKPADLPKLIDVLRQVTKEDPTIKIEINEETGEHLMHGMGELHLEVIENRIKTEKGIDVKTSQPIVVYRETIGKPSPEMEGKSPNKHNKLFFKVEPIDDATHDLIKKGEIREGRIKKKDLDMRDKLVSVGWDNKVALSVKNVFNGCLFLDATRGIVYINEILEMVMDMFEGVMKAGPIAREPCLRVKVSLTDCKLHEDAIHRGPAQIYPCVREGIRGAMMQANPIIFEPKQILQIDCPSDYMGEVSKIVSNKRGQLLEMNQEGTQTVIKAKLPVAEMIGWSSDLRSATGGRGNSSLIDQMFEKLPGELQEKIVRQIRERKGLTSGQVG